MSELQEQAVKGVLAGYVAAVAREQGGSDSLFKSNWLGNDSEPEVGRESLNGLAKSLTVTRSRKCNRLISAITSTFITPIVSGKQPVIEQPGVETFECFFPHAPRSLPYN